MADPGGSPERPPCPRCGVTTYPSRRAMRVHNLEGARAVPEQKVVDVWRCPACGAETPRG